MIISELHLKCISWNAIELLFSFPVCAMRLGLKFTLVKYHIAGNFREHKFSANHQKARQEKKFAIIIFATRSQYLTTPPTIFRMLNGDLQRVFQRQNDVR